MKIEDAINLAFTKIQKLEAKTTALEVTLSGMFNYLSMTNTPIATFQNALRDAASNSQTPLMVGDELRHLADLIDGKVKGHRLQIVPTRQP